MCKLYTQGIVDNHVVFVMFVTILSWLYQSTITIPLVHKNEVLSVCILVEAVIISILPPVGHDRDSLILQHVHVWG